MSNDFPTDPTATGPGDTQPFPAQAVPPQAGVGQPGINQPGINQPGFNQPGFNQPGMSQPTFGTPGQPEYLDAAGGAPLGPQPPTASGAGGGKRRGLVIGGIAVGALLIGAGAWAATSWYTDSGADVAEALPSTTLGYASINLDPSGAQKIEAIQTLNKFPAFKEELGLDADDDIRQRLFEEFEETDQCGIDFEKDIKPWLGNRAAIAAVDSGGDVPTMFAVVEVSDGEKADAGLSKISTCGGEAETGGWVIVDGWATIAETSDLAQGVVDATAKASLADDSTYTKLLGAAGEDGIATMYVAPSVGEYISDLAASAGAPFGMADEATGEEIESIAKDFKGMAGSVRFDDGALEVGFAGDTGDQYQTLYSSDQGADVMSSLPEGTAAAFGMGFEEGWVTQLAEQILSSSGQEMTVDEVMADLSAQSGLDLPADAETLVGESAVVAVSPDFDPETLFNSTDSSDLPVAVKVKGDPAEIEKVLDKLRAQDPEAEAFLQTEVDGDTIVIGPNTDYLATLAEGGNLGDSETFKDVVREADKSSMVFYIDFDAGDNWLASVAGDDASVKENLEPLSGIGASAWVEDGLSHGVLRITTD